MTATMGPEASKEYMIQALLLQVECKQGACEKIITKHEHVLSKIDEASKHFRQSPMLETPASTDHVAEAMVKLDGMVQSHRFVVEDAQEAKITFKQKLAECMARLATAEEQLAECQAHTATVDQRLAECQNRSATLQGQLAGCQDHSSTVEGQLDECEGRSSSLQEHLATAQGQLAELQNALVASQSRLTQVSQRMSPTE
ncbi:hypothetical protein ABBQ38_011784 [Trebouxia sp. C0009 RCD-2024]